jgi:hypothetical protein
MIFILAQAATLSASESDYEALGALLARLDKSPAVAPDLATKRELRRVREPAKLVTETVDNQVVITSPSPMDAINTAVDRREVGCVQVRFGSGFGWVATGMSTYGSYPNPTASRFAKRAAYVKAFSQAKAQMAQTIGGLSSTAKDEIRSHLNLFSDENADLVNLDESNAETIEQAAAAMLRGFAVYEVEDDVANNTVYVSIVTSPKTRAAIERPAVGMITAGSLEEGLNALFLEIQSGVVPPVGARAIQLRGTDHLAFVGFGSDVIRYHKTAQVQARLRQSAQKVAEMRAQDALIGAIQGDDTTWESRLDEESRAQVREFADALPGDPAGVQEFAQARNTFQNSQTHSETIKSVRAGQLPPGVQKKGWLAQNDAVAYSIAVWLPPMEVIEEPAAPNGDGKPAAPVERFPSGQVTDPSDVSGPAGENGGPVSTTGPGIDWLDNRPSEPGFLYGIGQAPATVAQSHQRSSANAYIDIVSQLFVSVSGETVVKEQMKISTSATEDEVEIVEFIDGETKIAVPTTTLIGAEIVDQKSRGGVVYTLARIQRADFVGILLGRVVEIDTDLRGLLPAPAPVDLGYVRRLLPVLPLIHERAGLAMLLRSLGQQAPPEPLPQAMLRQHLGRLVNGGDARLTGSAPAVRASLLQVLDQIGLTARENGKAAFEFRLQERKSVRVIDGWHRVRITATLTAVDGDSGEILGSIEHSTRRAAPRARRNPPSGPVKR